MKKKDDQTGKAWGVSVCDSSVWGASMAQTVENQVGTVACITFKDLPCVATPASQTWPDLPKYPPPQILGRPLSRDRNSKYEPVGDIHIQTMIFHP